MTEGEKKSLLLGQLGVGPDDKKLKISDTKAARPDSIVRDGSLAPNVISNKPSEELEMIPRSSIFTDINESTTPKASLMTWLEDSMARVSSATARVSQMLDDEDDELNMAPGKSSFTGGGLPGTSGTSGTSPRTTIYFDEVGHENLGEHEDYLSTVSSEGEVESELLGEEQSGEDNRRIYPQSLGDNSEIHLMKLEDEEIIRESYDDGMKRRRKKKVVIKDEKFQKKKSPEIEDYEEESEWVEPEYDREEFQSRPITSTSDTGINENILKFYHSYGYDTHRRNNIQSLDEEHIVYICGNYLHFYNVKLKKLLLILRSSSGYGLGHVTVHPSKKFIAVGEKGDHPYIMVYIWPDLKVFRVLRNGTMRGYAYIDFNSTGDLLCSQGLDPDYMLTIWDWFHEKIILRYKAFSQDVYRATFSLTNPGDLTTCGLGHIRFWKMDETFTGLKLLGQIGRFGKTEISDIFGFAGIADGKIVSGCEWGNMLIWDGGLIVVEVTQKEGKNCHSKEITDIVHQDADILTIGRDGYLRTWESELLDLAALSVDEDIGKVEVDPIFQLQISSNANLLSVARCASDDADNKTWFVQDSWGRVWMIDINVAMASVDYVPNILFFAPGGPINCLGLSTKYSVMVVGTEGGHLWVYEYIQKTVLARKVYRIPITKILWMPLKYDSTGLSFLAGFDDGTVRILALNIIIKKKRGNVNRTSNDIEFGFSYEFSLIQKLKFHKGRILILRIDENSDILYTTGSDRLIYGSKIKWKVNKPIIEPLSFVTSPFPVVSLDLHPFKDYRFIIAGRGGRVAECRRPIWGEVDSSVSFNQGKLHGRRWFYKSVKSNRRREEDREKRKQEKENELEELYKSMESRREGGIVVEEDLEIGRVVERYRKLQAKEDEKELYIPDKPCPILDIYYHINPRTVIDPTTAGQTFFIHVGGYDAGYVYECKYNRLEPGGFHSVPPTPPFTYDVAVNCFLLSPNDAFLLFGMTDGSIRVIPRQLTPVIEDKEINIKDKPRRSKQSSGSDDSDDDVDIFVNSDTSGIKKPKRVILPPFPISEYPYNLKIFWTLPMNDPDRGAVTQLAWSYDYKFLISVGQDGSIFSYRWDPDGKLRTNDHDLPTPLVPRVRHTATVVEDSEDPDGLTLEELKAKAEKDRLFELTEATKDIIRQELRKLKVDYRALAQRNDEIPEQFRLSRTQFELDSRIKVPRQTRFQHEIEEVYRKYEWEGARSVISCEKIQKFFLESIETHHQNVKDLEHTVEVHTFRHRFLSTEFLEIYAKNKDWMIDEELLLNALSDIQRKSSDRIPVLVKRFYAKDLIGEYAGKKYDVKTTQAIRQLEDRLYRRYIRQCEWADLNALKVPDDYEVPEDVEAVDFAASNMGDYKLKTAEEYHGEKITTAERRRRVMDLKIMIYESVQEFNRRVKALEEEKLSVIASSRKLEHQIKERHKYMPKDQKVAIPIIYDVEFIESPESLFIIAESNILQRQNQKLEASGLMKRKKLAYGEVDNEFFREDTPTLEPVKVKRVIHKEGDFLRGRNDPRAPKIILKKLGIRFTVGTTVQQAKTFMKHRDLEGLSLAVYKYRKAFYNPKTEAAQRRRDRILARRAFERDYHLSQLQKMIDYFKERVIYVRNERIELQLDVKLMGIGLLVLIQELDIVKEFDTAERGVMERFKAQKVECAAAKEKVDKAKRRLNQGKGEQGKVEDLLTKLAKEVTSVIGEKGRYSDYLWRVFKKRIRLETAEEEEDQDPSEVAPSSHASDSSSETGSTNSTSVDSDSDLYKLPKPKLNLNICPENLDRSIYNKVCELRQRKAHLEADFTAQKRVVEKLNKDFDEVDTVYKKFAGRLDGITQEVNILQKKKQNLINDLKKLVILKADQLQCFDEAKMELETGPMSERIKRNFPNMNDVIVFPKDGTVKLDFRIDELKAEIIREKEKQSRAHHLIVRLQEELRNKENRVTRLLEECRNDMIARFGRVIDLEEICACIINLEILDALIKLGLGRKDNYKDTDMLNNHIEQTRHRLATVTITNSDINTMLAILEERQRDVDHFLHLQNKATVPDKKNVGDNDGDVTSSVIGNSDVIEEMYNLEDRLINQEAKIEYIREVIAYCKLKVGIPPIAAMTSIPDTIGTQFMTLKELHEYKSLVGTEVETLFMKDNVTERLLQSNSMVPSFDVSKVLEDQEYNQEDYDEEEEVLKKLKQVTEYRKTQEKNQDESKFKTKTETKTKTTTGSGLENIENFQKKFQNFQNQSIVEEIIDENEETDLTNENETEEFTTEELEIGEVYF